MIAVTRLAITPVKGMRLRTVEQVELDRRGARGNRTFHVIDERGRMINGKQCGELQTVVADYDHAARALELTFPDGAVAHGRVALGKPLQTRFFSRIAEVRLVEGPWSEALSAHLGRSVRLVEPEIGVDRGLRGAISLISRASLTRLAREAGEDEVDARRFRMLIEIDGVRAHQEDDWIGRRLRFGGAELRMNGHVGRCLVTSRDPETGVIDLPTLDALGSYRRDLHSTEPLPFGVYGEVLEPGIVRVGDVVSLDR